MMRKTFQYSKNENLLNYLSERKISDKLSEHFFSEDLPYSLINKRTDSGLTNLYLILPIDSLQFVQSLVSPIMILSFKSMFLYNETVPGDLFVSDTSCAKLRHFDFNSDFMILDVVYCLSRSKIIRDSFDTS